MTIAGTLGDSNGIWEKDGLTYEEVVRQSYSNCAFSAGFLYGHPVDTLYVRWQRGDDDRLLGLRPDEAAALVYVLGGALWSHSIGLLEKETP